MEVLILQVFVSLVLVAGSLLLFVNSVRRRDYDHADRLALLPIADDDAAVFSGAARAAPAPPAEPSGSSPPRGCSAARRAADVSEPPPNEERP